MRLLILILLFSISAQGQIVRTHPYYRPTAAACSYLLDQYTGAAAAYSLRLLDCQYAGALIRVRRSSDNSEQDVYPTANGDLDTATLKTFVGTGGSDDGFVVTWYDQSGNSNNATQSTAVSQPLIMDNGVINRLSGKPTIVFDGSNDVLAFTRLDFSSATAFVVVRRVGSSAYQAIFTVQKSSSNLNQFEIALNNDGNYGPIIVGAEGNSTSYGKGGSLLVGSNRIITGIWLGGGTNGAVYYNAYDNNAAVSLSNSANVGAATAGISSIIGASISAGSVASYFNGWISELIIYPSDKSSDRSAINTAINTYYSIY